MSILENKVSALKKILEDAISNDGHKGKESAIRSSSLINLIHEAIKESLINEGVFPENIKPGVDETKPEMKIAGEFKEKKQDICVVPKLIAPKSREVDWGLLVGCGKTDLYGKEFLERTLVINVRSQLSSLAKNRDTLIERTISEAINLHSSYNKMVLGEVYLIPVYEYDHEISKQKRIEFISKKSDIEYYIRIFNNINNRKDINEQLHIYERCALIIVDFSHPEPKIYKNNSELILDGLIGKDFDINYEEITFENFTKDLLNVYAERFDIENIKE